MLHSALVMFHPHLAVLHPHPALKHLHLALFPRDLVEKQPYLAILHRDPAMLDPYPAMYRPHPMVFHLAQGMLTKLCSLISKANLTCIATNAVRRKCRDGDYRFEDMEFLIFSLCLSVSVANLPCSSPINYWNLCTPQSAANDLRPPSASAHSLG